MGLNQSDRHALWRGFKAFIHFAPKQQYLLFTLMLSQGFTAGIGLLLILPLLQLIGLDTGTEFGAGVPASVAAGLFDHLGIEIRLTSILVIYVLIVTLFASLSYLQSVLASQLQQRYTSQLRTRLFGAILCSHWQFILNHKLSDFALCLSAHVQTVGFAAQQMLTLVSQIVLASVMVCLVVLLSWQMSVLAALFAFVLLALLMPLNRYLYGSGSRELMGHKKIYEIIIEQLASIKMIKSYGNENRHIENLRQISDSMESQQVRFMRITALTQWVYKVGAVVAFAVFFFLALTTFLIPLSSILLMLIIFARLLPQVSGIQRTYQQLIHKAPAFRDVTETIKACEAEQESCLSSQAELSLHREIRLHNLSYQYPSRPDPVFKALSLTLKKNQTLALTGPSGTGKSTLADLIAGLLEPTHGHIFIDGQKLEGEQHLRWRRSIAYVTQEVYLFHASIRDNLNWVVNQPVSDKALWQVLQLAAADTFVRQLPEGLDTVIGDRGIRLSGGERQRIALARALLSKPQLLILDEATSALDPENEGYIQQALEQLDGRVTMIIIAHREGSISHVQKRFDVGRNKT